MIKYAILDFGKVLAYPTNRHWFITPKFKRVVGMNKINMQSIINVKKKN